MPVFGLPDDMEEAEYLRQCVLVDDVAIQEEYMRLPSDMAYWTERYAAAKETHLVCKHQRERIYSTERAAVRAEMEAAGTKVTEGRIDEQVIPALKVEAARSVEIGAEVEVLRLHGVLEALRSKKEMLNSLVVVF